MVRRPESFPCSMIACFPLGIVSFHSNSSWPPLTWKHAHCAEDDIRPNPSRRFPASSLFCNLPIFFLFQESSRHNRKLGRFHFGANMIALSRPVGISNLFSPLGPLHLLSNPTGQNSFGHSVHQWIHFAWENRGHVACFKFFSLESVMEHFQRPESVPPVQYLSLTRREQQI